MSTVASLFAQLQAELRETRGVDPLRELAARLVDPAQHADLSVKERLDLAFTALRRLFDATAGDVEAAETALQQLLVPLCIGSALPPAADAETEQYHLRGLLESWLKGCSQDRFETVRAAILQRAVEMLGQGDPQQAAWTISRIGYRDDGIVNALLEAAERCDHEGMDPEVGSVMLDVAVRLGVPAEERQRIIDAVRARARRGFSWGLATAILWLADEELVTEYFAEWVSAAAEHPRAGLGQLARWPSEVAAKSPGDVDLQSRMWALLETALEPEPGDVVADAFYGSDLSSQVNHPGVVAALLRWLGGRRGDDHVRSRQLLCERLTECVLPQHLVAWDAVLEGDAWQQLSEDAVTDVNEVRTTQSAFMHTRYAPVWDLVCRAGRRAMLPSFDEALRRVQHPSALRDILKVAACVGTVTIPDKVRDWVTTPHTLRRDGTDEEWPKRAQAYEVVASAANRDAFETLLGGNLQLADGDLLRRCADTLAAVSVGIEKREPPWASARLLGRFRDQSVPRHQRLAAIVALDRLAQEDLLGADTFDQIAALLLGPCTDELLHAFMASTIGHAGTASDDTTRRLAELAELVGAESEPDLRTWCSLEALARLGRLHEYPRLMKQLGLQLVETTWRLAAVDSRAGLQYAGLVIGLLYANDPVRMGVAVGDAIRDGPYLLAAQLPLQLMEVRDSARELPDNLRAALLDRTSRGQTASRAEMTWFAILAQLAPAELVQDPWEAQWSAWLDDAREALGQALGLIPPGPQSARAADLGLLLVMDPCYAVRRAAYRSLAIHAPDSLRGFVEVGMSTETPTALRRRAAEAAEWVDVTPGQLAALAADPELDVREAARAAERSARRRVWVDDYMGTVLSAAREGGDAVLGAWRHGAALAQLGDDGTLRQLRQRAQDPQIEPHARYWLGHLSQQLETRWRKAMIEWPQPWEQYDGAIEQGDGTLSKDGEATVVRVRYFLWQSPGDHVKLPSWGGTISSFGEEAWPPGGASIVKPGEAELTLQDGQRKGRVWCGLPVMPRGRHPVDGVETYPA